MYSDKSLLVIHVHSVFERAKESIIGLLQAEMYVMKSELIEKQLRNNRVSVWKNAVTTLDRCK